MRFRDLFTAKAETQKSTAQHCIPDVGGHYFITEEYMKEGVDNGWLIYTGYYRDLNNELVYTYSLVNGADCV